VAKIRDRRDQASCRARALRLGELAAACTYRWIAELVEAFPQTVTATILEREIKVETRA